MRQFVVVLSFKVYYKLLEMLKEALIQLYERDLQKLKKEIELYSSESNLWKVDHQITNSGGNLCLHLIGNLKAYIGNGLAELKYTRERHFEFTGKHVARQQLIEDIDETSIIIKKGLQNLTQDQLASDFPILIWKEKTGMIFTLMHLHSHLNYHLGQINYHRRMLDK